ncbi:hypothetical protein P152DRAFT_511594 [Eremomyces bilateralis CBS 781.70]|uniref:Uncharacterized protein n=1 Tax=Eremomyces bilateralis CBS 781.70 TaxID=1392243 RepID=A0A6G1GBL2_9PEZI|nr:uncharacterized protein P152DRAFT_511594 [Eremomyces bilateralis CBS 781.70]KAF1815443.1 hypothetical protein P152DRAFT_511594 [Eremomyces bilateralis CBS 781.70]
MADLQLKSQLPDIARKIKSGSKLFEKYRTKRGFAINADEQLHELLHAGPRGVQSPYNKLVLRLGEEFAKGDDECIARFNQISVDIERLIDQLALRLDNAEGEQGVVFDPEVEQEWESELHDTLEEKMRKGKSALSEFVQRRWKITPTVLLGSPVNHSSLRRMHGSPYCPGALRLQRDLNASILDVATTLPNGESFRCEECGLELKDLELPQQNHSEEGWTAVARTHVRASISLKDRRAWFMCVECQCLGREHYTVSVRALIHHLKEHVKLKKLRDRLDAARSTVVL